MQNENGTLPVIIDVDTAFSKLPPNASPFLKDVSWSVNSNPNTGNGITTTIGEGQNELVLTPMRSNKELPNVILPEGYNKTIGTFESETTQELYYFIYNSNGNHCIFVIEGDSLICKKVIEDPELQFTDDQEAFITGHRVNLRAIYDADKNIIEKYLLVTDGNSWQKFINVIASIETDGFNAVTYPYWTLKQPHFDRRELLEWAVRPPMYKPVASMLPNTSAQQGAISRVIDQSFQFAINFTLTDGRYSTLSPYSLPLQFKSEDYQNNPENLPKRGLLRLSAGSPLIERVNIYVRKCGGKWLLYESVYKYTSCGNNSKEVIGNKYWLRKDPFADYNYDITFNTFDFIFDNARVAEITDLNTVNRLQSDMPQRSVSLTDLGDSALLGWNEYGYDNFSCEVTSNLGITVKEKVNVNCNVPLRRIRLYAYIGRCGDNFNYCSQVAYFLGDDKQVRFGGLDQGIDNIASFAQGESNTFQLNFADKNALRCYLKGTPYYADGKWYQVNSDFSLALLDAPFDFSQQENLIFAQNIFNSGAFFICVFDLIVPAGRYIATLGRHNVASSGDYRNTSTYIAGIANSRITTETGNNLTSLSTQNSIVTYSKEMELDCTAADVDVWGNGSDTFYVYCPYVTNNGNKKFRFIEGYLYEQPTSPFPIELFPYDMTEGGIDDNGQYTDKNGFYFGYTKEADSDVKDIRIVAKINCTYPVSFVIPTVTKGTGWKQNNPTYLSNNNAGQVGSCNRIIYTGKITSLDGSINYSNIAISIKDGSTVFSNFSGEFSLVIHNGLNALRQSNIYVNAGGNFLITTEGCGQIPLNDFSENLTPCVNCNERIYPTELILGLNVQGFTQTSVKEGARYSAGIVGGDLAGRLMFVNPLNEVTVPSFLERDNTNATYFQLLINSGLQLAAQYPDIKWVAPYISKNLTSSRYLQWVGDKIQYIDNNGNVTTDPSSAVFCAIYIDSLYNYNLNKNLSVIANYQFVKGDRLRIIDNGEGDLLDVAQYGNPIDIQIEGTNYNQVAINSGLLPPTTNTVLTPGTTELNQSVTLIVRYDSRLDKLIDKTGFWIEMYTPSQEIEQLTYCEVAGFYPIIQGKIAVFTGFVNQLPQYDFPTAIDLEYWDTYLFSRNITIPDVGNKFFAHPFESANVSDSWGEGCSSCGRQYVKNDNARRTWYKDDAIKSDDFITEGFINGLGTFRGSNRKNFKGYSWGGIVAMKSQRSVIIFVCENDWFVTNFNFQYIFANAAGVQIANLDNKLSEPLQKIGDNYGCALEDTSSIISHDDFITWYDFKNSAWVICNYQTANDISMGGLQSYLNAKTQFIKEWNNTVGNDRKFDVVSGIDKERNNLYITFRPRRKNSNLPVSYVNKRRNWDVKHQETVVYNIDAKKWVRAVGFTPESYGAIKGKKSGLEFFSFAAGKPWQHKNVGNTSFLTYYGEIVEPVICGVINQNPELVKILQSMAIQATMKWFVDLIFGTQPNSYSYIPLNYFKEKEKVFYAEVLKDFVSYPSPKSEDLFRSMLQDGKRVFSEYFFYRFVGNPNEPNKYRELRSLYWLLSDSPINKK